MKNEAGCWDSNYSGGTGYIHENSSNNGLKKLLKNEEICLVALDF